MSIDWQAETGLELNNDFEAEAFYDTHQQDHWPDFEDVAEDPELRPLLRYIESARDGETLEDLKGRVSATRDVVAVCKDPMRARYDAAGRDGLAMVAKSSMDKALVISEGLVGASPDSATRHALLWLARNITKWTNPSTETREHEVEFQWSRLTCFFGGVNDALQDQLWRQISQTAPTCPWAGAVDAAALQKAHTVCGWPVSLSALPWGMFCAAAGDPIAEDQYAPDWMVALCVAHVLRHVRLSRDGGRLRVLYNGVASTVAGVGKLDASDTLDDLRPAELLSLKKKLRIPLKLMISRTQKDVVADAMGRALAMLRVSDIPMVRPLSELPIQYLVGPWSILTTSGVRHGHGLRVMNVMEISPHDAETGKAKPVDLTDTELVMEYDWDLAANTSWCFEEFRRQKAMTPDTFPLARPSTFIREAFPHVVFDSDMLDAVIYGDLMRSQIDLSKEFPLLLTLAKEPTMDKATNQGKSTFATALSRIMCPGINMTAMRDSSSAPDIRAMAGIFEKHGTLCADEFVMPKSKVHFMNRECLQQLCTGAAVPVGKALENQGEVELEHPLMLCAKAIELSHDLMNRSVPLYVGELDTKDRARGELIDQLESGEWSNLVRMSAVAFVVGTGMVDVVEEAAKTGGTVRGAWRFRHHLAIATLLRQDADDSEYQEAFDKVCEASTEAFDSLVAHTTEGTNSGLLAELATGTNSSLGTLEVLFGDMEPCVWEEVYCEVESKKDKVLTPGQLLLEVAKAVTHRASLSKMEAISRMNSDQTFRNNLAVSRYMGQIVGKKMVGDGDMWMPAGSNYTFVRHPRAAAPDGYVLKLTPNDRLAS
jgi:hypothetical protein